MCRQRDTKFRAGTALWFDMPDPSALLFYHLLFAKPDYCLLFDHSQAFL
jgi:hypothetical protein